MGFAVLYVLLARQLHLSPGLIGLISATSAVGGLGGALVANRFAQRVGQGPAICISAFAFAPGEMVAPFVQHNWSLVLLAVGQGFTSMSSVVYNITQVSFRQGLTPPELLGRMNATMRFLVWGTMPLGALLGGVFGSLFGARETLLIAAVLVFGTCVPVILSPLRSMPDLLKFV